MNGKSEVYAWLVQCFEFYPSVFVDSTVSLLLLTINNPTTMSSALSKRFLKIRSVTKTEVGIHATAAEGQLRVRFFNDAVAQITITQAPAFDDFSYAVQSTPSKSTLLIQDQSRILSIKSALLEVTINKDPVTVTFKDSRGQILNEEDPGLGTSWIGEQVTTYKRLQKGERFIGLGEKTGPLDRKGTGYQNWNTDSFAYHAGADPLYCSIPFYIGVHHGLQYGIFFDNSHKSFFNFGASNNRFSTFSADAGEMNYYFISGVSVADIISRYTELTGRMPLPPKWSIGYQQCRYSYYPDSEIRIIANTFRQKKIPADVIVLDIHYMDKYKIFTWDNQNFPDASSLIQYLKSQNFEVVLMCDPGIKIETGYDAYDDGLRKDVFVKYPDGENYSGQVWPGWCHFPDFTNPKVRSWWKEKLTTYTDLGIAGYWNDMNEIATWGQMLPENLEFDYDGNKSTTRRARNVYGFQMARGTYEGVKELLGKRPFNLTRAGYSGVQRYAAVWTGDNVSYDEHMMLGIRLVNSLGLAGVAFAGYDVGGFVGEASTQLFARWISIGALSPFFRGHTMINSRDAEPWSFGEEVEQISRNYIQFRYQLMPYLYSLFYESATNGMPVQRSLAIANTHDAKVYDPQFQHQYLFGPFILVAPVESNKDFVKVYFPPGEWYSLFDGAKYAGGQEVVVTCPIHKLPIFIKGGAIIPMQKVVQHTNEKVEELSFHIYQSKENSSFEFYEDDGITFDYEANQYAIRLILHHGAKNSLTIGEQQGSYHSNFKQIRIILHGFELVRKVVVNGKSFASASKNHSFFQPMEKFDPLIDPASMGEETVYIASFPYSSELLDISW